MAIIPCALTLKQCLPCNDDPIRNITAEAPDVDVFIGFRDFKWNPPLGDTYFQLACKTICFSEVSQLDADLCALRSAQECVWDGGSDPPFPPVPPGPNSPGGKGSGPNLPPTNPRNPIQRYRNTVQSCSAHCPDGSPFTETVPAGTITELSQALADAKAKSLACKMAQRNLFCISGTAPPSACVEDDYFFLITTNMAEDLIWSIDGELPPGLNFNFDGTISGMPSVAGSYTFLVEATDSLGRFQSQVLTICVMEIITDATLPGGALGQIYAEPLIQQPATVSSEVWTLVSGSLPDGILLAPNGSLTGIPTAAGISAFTIKVDAICDGVEVSCQKEFNLEIGGPCGIDWNTINWDTFTLNTFGGGIATGSAVGDTIQFNLENPPGIGSADVSAHGSLVADCHACSFKLRINLIAEDDGGPLGITEFTIVIAQDGVQRFVKTHGHSAGFTPTLVIGINEFDVPLIQAAGSLIEIGVSSLISDGFGNLHTQLEMSITLSDT